jgi:hypothetical protein
VNDITNINYHLTAKDLSFNNGHHNNSSDDEGDETRSEASNDTSSTTSEDRQIANVAQKRLAVATQLQKLWKNSTWLGFAKLDGEEFAMPLDVKVAEYLPAQNKFCCVRTVGQQRFKCDADVKMYYVARDSADVVISISDTGASTPTTGSRLKLVADTIRGRGHSITGHCVLGGRTGVFELLRDKLTSNEVGENEKRLSLRINSDHGSPNSTPTYTSNNPPQYQSAGEPFGSTITNHNLTSSKYVPSDPYDHGDGTMVQVVST